MHRILSRYLSRTRDTVRFLPVSLVFLAILPGCAVWEFGMTRYENVTGYFNTYYNAKKVFNEAMEEINAERVNQSFQHSQAAPPQPIPFMPPTVEPSDASGVVDASGMVPDAGMTGMTGMPAGGPGMPGMPGMGMRPPKLPETVPSGALAKFDKVIEKCSRILINYSRSKWVDNALLMIGISYYYKMEYGKAEKKFKELLDGFPDGSLHAEGLYWLGKNYDAQEFYAQAEETFNKAIERGIEDDEPDVVADAHFALGRMALQQSQSEKAIAQFAKAADVARDEDKRIQIYLALARQNEAMGNKKDAAEAYRDIIQLNPSSELSFNAELNYARLARETNQIDEAVNTLLDMLDNPAYLDYDGQIQLEIGHLYVTIGEYNAAMEQYTFVDTTFKTQPVASEAFYALGRLYETKGKNYDKAYENYDKARTAYPGVEAARLGGLRADDFAEYRRLRNRLFESDTLLFYVLHPDSLAARDSVQAIRDSVARTTAKQEGPSEDEQLRDRIARRRPHGRNTGRINPFAMQAEQATGLPMTVGSTPQAPAANLPPYRRLKLDEISPDSLLRVISEMRMEMGWVMFDKVKDIDSAFYYYSLAIDGTLSENSRANAYYTMAELARRTGDTVLARDYEDRLIRENPNSRFALSVMQTRGMALPKDSNTIAIEAYERAAQLLEAGKYTDGIQAMQMMAQSYPHSDQAARAKLAVALTYEIMLDQGPKALEFYRLLLKEHPNSKYAQRARDILASIDRIKTEEEEAEQKKEERKKAEEKQKVEEAAARERAETEKKSRIQKLLYDDLKQVDSLRNAVKKKSDPTKDLDFPLNLPGDRKPKSNPAPGQGDQQSNPRDPGVPPERVRESDPVKEEAPGPGNPDDPLTPPRTR